MSHAVLLTGPPGCGKTTCIMQVLALLPLSAGGFYTREWREGGVRRGFHLMTLDGRQAVLADIRYSGRPRVGKYGVDLAVLEGLGVGAIRQAAAEKDLIVIDEIGPMELLSPAFREAVIQALDARVLLLGTIMARSQPFADAVKARPDVLLVHVHRGEQDAIVQGVLRALRDQRTEGE